MDSIVHSRPTDTNYTKTTETDLSFNLLDDGILFSFQTVNTLIDLENHDNNNNYIKITITILIVTLPVTQMFRKTTNI